MNVPPFLLRLGLLVAVLALLAGPWLGDASAPTGRTAPAAATTAAAAVTGAPAVACTDVLVLGVDGSGRRGWSGGGFGPSLRPAVASFQRRAARGGARVAVRHLGARFPKAETLVGVPGRVATRAVTRARVRAWLAGVPAAAGQVAAELRTRAAACPRETYVLAGHAQGAAAVHRVLLRLAAPMRARLVGAVLTADGDRVARSRSTTLGAPAAPVGGKGVVTRYLTKVGDVPTARLPVAVATVCSKGDLVCDTRQWSVARSLAAHRSYGTRAGLAAQNGAASVMWGRANAWPRPVAGQAVLTAADERFSRTVAVRVAPAYAGDTVFGEVRGLPPGVTMSPAGVVSGTVPRTGTWRVTFSVRNARLGTSATAGSLTISSTTVSPRSGVSAGGQVSCQVRRDATAWCGGDNAWGQLGVGTTRDSLRPVQVGGAEWASLDTSGATTCGIKLTAALFCWGMNTRGQLGLGATTQKWTPQRVAGSGWAQVSTGWLHTCGVTAAGTLHCWGDNSQGQLGTGDRTLRRTPTRIGTETDWRSVSVGGWHTCAVRASGAAYCWGRNDLGQLGTGRTTAALRPTRVASTVAFGSVDASWSSTCGVVRGARIACWGDNELGQLGDGSRATRTRPVIVTGTQTWRSVAVGDGHTCAVDFDRAAWCWGGNRYGQRGDGTRATALTPERVLGGGTWAGLDVGWLHTCGLSLNDRPQCWGNNEQGQLWSGNRADRPTPPGVRVPAERRAPRAADQQAVITSFNVLGSQHTQPGGGALNYAPGRIRGEWTANLLQGKGADIVAFQELQADQYTQLRRSMGPAFGFYPASANAGKIVWQSVMWDTRQWTFVSAVEVSVPMRGTTRPNPMVRLRSRLTGKDIWVFNVHNSAKNTPDRIAERRRAVRIEIDRILPQRRARIPVVFLGDMNEKEPVFCTVTRRTDLYAVNGGSRGATCRPPAHMRIDWIFVSPEFATRAHAYDRSPRIARITDHSVLTATTSVPGS